MRSVILLLGLCVAVLARVDTLWPLPQQVTHGALSARASVASSFSFTSSSDAGCYLSPILQKALARYPALSFPFGAPTDSAGITGVVVCVRSQDTTLNFDSDESYMLSAPSGSSSIALNATTVFGALRGLETVAQLVELTQEKPAAYAVAGLPISIADKPRFAWRGLMLDTARHFLPVSHIIHTLDAMVASKFNVLHWHMTDAQSFPYVSKEYPELSNKGAFHPAAIFTPADVDHVVQYGLERGIRVMVEFDVPGHAYAWGFHYPITADCGSLSANINNIPFTPVSDLTLPILESIINQAASAYPDAFLHLGGDEVVTSCWSKDPAVVAWMNARGWTPKDVYQYFVTKAQEMAMNAGKIPVYWQEVFTNGLKMHPSSIVHVWQTRDTVKKSVKAGFKTLLSGGWYLDKQQPNASQTWYGIEDTWKDFYQNDPTVGLGLSAQEEKLVLGGEACMWSEQVDVFNWDSRVWPRAAAAAERLWSAETVTDLAAAATRLSEHSCRLQRRGVRAGPIKPGFCLVPASVTP